MFATSNYQKMDGCRKIDGNKIFDISELFRCFFRSFFDVFSMFFVYVLSFYIMSFLYFCFSMFCRSMFRHRSTPAPTVPESSLIHVCINSDNDHVNYGEI